MTLVLPWLFGFVGLGIGVVFLGGDSYWLFATGYIPVALGYVVVWP